MLKLSLTLDGDAFLVEGDVSFAEARLAAGDFYTERTAALARQIDRLTTQVSADSTNLDAAVHADHPTPS